MALNTGSTFSSIANVAPSGPQTATTALARSDGRIAWSIQNQGTNVLYVLLGAGASSSAYSVTLKACSVAADGTGGSFSMEAGAVYCGVVSVAGTSPSYSVVDMST
jgi:hypothetical protein